MLLVWEAFSLASSCFVVNFLVTVHGICLFCLKLPFRQVGKKSILAIMDAKDKRIEKLEKLLQAARENTSLLPNTFVYFLTASIANGTLQQNFHRKQNQDFSEPTSLYWLRI